MSVRPQKYKEFGNMSKFFFCLLKLFKNRSIIVVDGKGCDIIERPIISDKFDVEDIRKIREYNHKRRMSMTKEEILLDIEEGEKRGLELLEKIRKESISKLI